MFFCFFMLQMVANGQKIDIKKNNYKKLWELYFDNEGNNAKQLEFANAYLSKAKNEKVNIRIAKGYYLFSIMNEGDKAIMYMDSVIKYSSNTNDLYFPAAAYTEKAFLLKNQFKFKEAVNNYVLAEKVALKNNPDYYYVVRNEIAITKSEFLGENDEALDIFKECFRYYKTKNILDKEYSAKYLDVIFGLADVYKSKKQTDSTTYYNKLGYKESLLAKEKEYLCLFILNEGANQFLKKNYKAGLDSIDIALPKLKLFKNNGNILASYYYRGKIYEGLGEMEVASKNFIKVDSMYQKNKNITPEFMDGYPFLISFYKNKGDKTNQLKYLSTYMDIDIDFQKKYKQWDRLMIKKYDLEHLTSEKETIIQSLKIDKTKSYWGLVTLFLLLLTASGFAYRQHQLKKTYKIRFQKIIEITKPVTENKDLASQIETQILPTKIDDLGIARELVETIRKKLVEFEKQKDFLKPTLTLQLLSQEFDTNTKYLSKIINECKGKPFITYINDLRINYCVLVLQKDLKLRKYTIQALSQEFGFNTAESFSTAFFKKTGLKPSFFITELENIKKPFST
jgi:AraC-like DNA-binding protein